jgi:hypothetical protein
LGMYYEVLCWLAKLVLPLDFYYVFNLYFTFNLPVGLDYFLVMSVLGVCYTVKGCWNPFFLVYVLDPLFVIVSVSMLLCIGPHLLQGTCRWEALLVCWASQHRIRSVFMCSIRYYLCVHAWLYLIAIYYLTLTVMLSI